MTDWSRRFDDVIELPDSMLIKTVSQAAEYVTSLFRRPPQ
jgi:hypothetical protein